MIEFEWHILLRLGALLGIALMAGGLADFMRLPKVTAYLLIGVLLGPEALHLIGTDHLPLFEPLTKLAISLILFNLGCHFPLARARRILRRVLRLSLGELVATFVLVGLGVTLLDQRWEVGLLLGILALATAPATTILVLKEMGSEGPITEHTNALVAVNNLVSIVLFETLFLAILFVQDQLPGQAAVELGFLARDLLGAVVLGVVGGLLVSYCYGLVSANRRLILLMAVLTLLLSICEIHQMPYLLTFLAMGATLANSSDQTRNVLQELDRLTGLFCVVFFVIHGADLRLDMLSQIGAVGVAYIGLRFTGKYFGIRVAARMGGDEPAIRTWLGATLFSQAGAAIALSAIAVQRTAEMGGDVHEICQYVQSIILGTVVIFEIVGPLAIRQATLLGGEVPLVNAIHHTSPGFLYQFRVIWNRLLIAAGLNPWKRRSAKDVSVSEMMRKNVRGISQEALFDEVVTCIEHSHDNTYPVVGNSDELIGVIRYRELSSALFDPALGTLVRATDIATPAGWVLHPDEPIARAYAMFEASKDDCLPVVTREKPYHLLGIVRRRDILRFLIRGQADTKEDDG